MKLRVNTPADDKVHDLAPRVEGTGDYVGEYGYAVAITSDAKILVIWDDRNSSYVDPEDVILSWGYA